MMRFQMPPGAFPRLLRMTAISIVVSVSVTGGLTWSLFGQPRYVYYSGYDIWQLAILVGFVVPFLVSPFVIWRLALAFHKIGVAQEALSRLATTDALTGLLNRRGFEDLAERAILEARAADMPVSALACDIDWFKSINDRFGHDAGDVVIRCLGDKLRTCFEPLEALVCRHGGEEFVVLLPGLSGAYATKWAERLRATCAAETPTKGGLPVAFSVSVGVAEMSQSGGGLRDLLRCADIALYEAKSNGRNRVERYAPKPLRRAVGA